MSHVSFETAIKLYNARFPQPSPGIGQIWYGTTKTTAGATIQALENGNGVLLANDGSEKILFLKKLADAFDLVNRIGIPGIIFAPTAEDILEQLPITYHLCVEEDRTGFVCNDLYGNGDSEFFHENASEACAVAYLKLNSK